MNICEAPLTQASAFPGNLLRRCHQISVAIFLKQCQALGLTQLQYVILSALEEKGTLEQSRIGGLTALDRNTTAVVVRKLEERGLVTRRRNERDRRSLLVSLTEEGRALRRQAEAGAAATQEELTMPLSESERAMLCTLLQRIADKNNALSRVPLSQGV
ncbi:transcriptional regulator, MarR family [Modicisalibacter muralis]|uniref:Transcriptional regulator, MarR family n=1 Tax=Modicisalibacter muralis TaxID=119000 RepID=A0A1G9JR60_9GAMM|nr:MarR family transcriptional regulator [Halomonas muralis]SDL39921.1 transcriptional regulator, MarR family [Halomonas muralis]